MIQSQQLFSSGQQPFIFATSPFYHTTPCQVMDFCDFPSSFPSPGESSSVFSSSSYVPTMFPDEFLDLENFGNGIHISSPMEEGLGLEISSEEMEDICGWINGNATSLLTIEGNQWSSPCLSHDSSQNSTVAFPVTEMPQELQDVMEIDDQLSLIHLLMAYGEAMENGQKELTKVIVKSINEKNSPVGSTMERVAYNMFQSREEPCEYIRQEASNNFLPAFKALYQSLPNSRFAHFTATTAILKSIPDDTETIHIIDFHTDEGIQWPLLIEALSWKQKQVWITSVKSEEGHTWWNFEDTKKQLLSHARQYGVKLKIDEKTIGDLSNELITRQEIRGQGREWLVFNCMVGLPHMTGRRTRTSVTEFLKVAKELLRNRKGILVVGDGEAAESLSICSSYSLYFDHLLRHYQALFESLERSFPVHLTEARTAMENLFLSPFMCPEDWFKEWKEMKKGYHDLIADVQQMEGVHHSQESFAVAKQMMSTEEDSYYKVRIDVMKENSMVLQWKETPLVRVSTWM